MEKNLSFREADIEGIVDGLIELSENLNGMPTGGEVSLDYNSEWNVYIGVRRK
jgi:hypothetical protein